MLKIVLGILLTSCISVCSAAEVMNTTVQNTVSQSTKIVGGASEWHLSESEWIQYLQLMNGKAGQYYAHLTPPEVLGMMANNDQDLHHFAKIYAQLEHEKIENELKFDRAFHDEAMKLYPNEPVIKSFDVSRYSPSANKSEQHHVFSSGDHLALFVDLKSQSTFSQLPQLIEKLKSTQGTTLDIYLINARENQDIQRWARDNQIPIDYVLTKRITLNHGENKTPKLSQNNNYPYVLLVRDGQSRMIDWETL